MRRYHGVKISLVDNAARMHVAQKAALVSAVSTSVVVVFKLLAAAFSGSIAVLAEALQSTLDVALALVAFWTLKVASKPADEGHPFGHGKAELLLSAFQMILVMLTSVVIAWQAALHLHDPHPIKPDWGLAAMSYSVVANAVMIVYLKRKAAQTGSAALEGEAEHLRGDALASLGILVGLLAYVATGWRQLDPIVAIAFTLLGAYFAFKQLRKVLHPLMDGALPDSDLRTIERVLDTHPESRGYHNVLTRQTGVLRVVSLHVMLDDDLSFVVAHDIAEHIEQELSDALGGALVTVHYEPYEAELEHRHREHGD